jgi:hypothetical protein
MSIRFSEQFVLENTNTNRKGSIYSDLFSALRKMTTDQSFLLPKTFNAASAQTSISIAGNALEKNFSRFRTTDGDGNARWRIFRNK